MDSERTTFEEEIDTLVREKTALEENILRIKQQRSTAKLHLDDMTQRIDSMELRQENLLNFLEKIIQNPTFVEYIAQKIESMDLSACNKRRRLPEADRSKTPIGESSLDNNSTSRPEVSNVIQPDFSNKLRLELSPAVSDINVVSHSTQSSTDDGTSPHLRIYEGNRKEACTRTEGNLFVPETFELADTGASLSFKMGSFNSRKVPAHESPSVHSLQQRLSSNEEADGHVSCQLNLTLASSLQFSKRFYPSSMSQSNHNITKAADLRQASGDKDSDTRSFVKSKNVGNQSAALSSSQEAPSKNSEPSAPPARVNDVFWEQFLTERPGSSDNEEASSSYRANPYEEQEDRRSGHGMTKNSKSMEQLTL